MPTLTVDGGPLSPRQMGANDGLGYGRFDRGRPLELHAYELVAALGVSFERLVEEMKVDDLTDEAPSALCRMGYPSLREAFLHPGELAEVIDTFLDRELLVAFVPYSASSELIINSTDEVLVTAIGVTLRGRCFRRRDVPA